MDELLEQYLVEHNLDIPFKNFTPGQVVQSKEFNDDMGDIEEKLNEVISKYNLVVNSYKNHTNNYENPHKITAHQVGANTIQEVSDYVDDLKSGNLNDNSITNRVLADECVDTRNIKNGSITPIKFEENFGMQLDISNNIDIVSRYTKTEVDGLIDSRVGDGVYSKEEVDNRFNQVQAGQIVEKSIDVTQLKDNIGRLINLSSNPSIIDRYTKIETENLIASNGIPSDFGSISESTDRVHYKTNGSIPIVDVMTCGEFITAFASGLDIDIAEVIDSRNGYISLGARLDTIETTLDNILNMFSEVSINV